MLITFRCKAYANVTMFGDIGLALLKMMGHSGSVPGAIRAEDVAEALSQLKAELAAQAQAEQSNADENDAELEPVISLSTRAQPLIELLSSALKKQCDVMWDS
ncbi:DUF1840 domain-containing protein [Agarivorans aestuarii]|uniref:DUF1840 domain-containing protein n=1 Tax=Agarivorans aestuarii TaxID=1563703 RepID=UPI001C7F3EC0|nr:DUF1840 domain-containing protein [Agarivorans aestuarii]